MRFEGSGSTTLLGSFGVFQVLTRFLKSLQTPEVPRVRVMVRMLGRLWAAKNMCDLEVELLQVGPKSSDLLRDLFTKKNLGRGLRYVSLISHPELCLGFTISC